MGLIDAELLKKHLDIPDCMMPQKSVIEAIDREPTVEEDKGNWRLYDEEQNLYECSQCSFLLQLMYGTPGENEYYFCPRCGAKLTEVANE